MQRPSKRIELVDQEVGARLRERRKASGLSQEKLADSLGLTFQQIQKYEKGTNRISASKLQIIARVLEVPVSFFFGDGNTAAAKGGKDMAAPFDLLSYA